MRVSSSKIRTPPVLGWSNTDSQGGTAQRSYHKARTRLDTGAKIVAALVSALDFVVGCSKTLHGIRQLTRQFIQLLRHHVPFEVVHYEFNARMSHLKIETDTSLGTNSFLIGMNSSLRD